MDRTNLLQRRINELNSAILDYRENKVYITGFYNAEQLTTHLNVGKDNWSSKGIYEPGNINFHSIHTDALFIIKKNNIEPEKYQFKKLLSKTVSLRSKKSKITITIRKNIFGDDYSILTEEKNYWFHNIEELTSFLKQEFKEEIIIEGEE